MYIARLNGNILIYCSRICDADTSSHKLKGCNRLNVKLRFFNWLRIKGFLGKRSEMQQTKDQRYSKLIALIQPLAMFNT